VESAHDCSEGGIAVTLAESAFQQGIGLRAELPSAGLPPEFVLFGEDASRIVISCDQSRLPEIKELAVKYGLSSQLIGETLDGVFEIRLDGQVVVSATVSQLRQVYEDALEKTLKTDPELVAAD